MERETQYSEFEEKTVAVNRCAKVVKGGRRFSLSALVVVGNRNGKIGVGMGKAKESAEAVRKASESARRNLVEVSVKDGTIPHEIAVKFGATRMRLMPAAPGTGVIASAAARAVFELAGVHNILTKTYGSSNPHTVVHACIEGLTVQRNKKQFAALRGGVEG
ncbi:MAG: 30S ribosomal protein S5 [Fibromonadaceae bacterium]|jgi:small subunit ribosomal protein S5|nr:30S ribosomal protein S5 [Fibromonadaceae bacterium]